MMKKVFGVGLAVALTLGLPACSSNQPSDTGTVTEVEVNNTSYTGPSYTLQFGHAGAEGSLEDATSLKFKELVEEKSGGKIQIDVFGNAQLGGLSDLVDAIRYGTVDIAIFAITDADSYYPKADLISLPYLFSDLDHVEAFYDSDLYAEMCDEFSEQTNCREMGTFHAGFRCILSNREIHTADDMKGLIIRIPEIQSYVSTFGALGCNTISLPASEVYQGLSTGLIEATEAAPSYMRTQNYQDQTDYCILSRHIYCGNSIFMSQSTLDGLDASAVSLLQEAAQEAAEYARGIAEEEDAAALQAFEDAGLTIIEPDRQTFQSAMDEVWDELIINRFDDGQEMIDAVLACDPG